MRFCMVYQVEDNMNKAEKILEYVHKIAAQQNISYEDAEQLAITREFIKNVEDDCEVINRD